MEIILKIFHSTFDTIHFKVIDLITNEEIGYCQLLIINDIKWLNGIQVNDDFLTKGYGKSILKALNNHHKPFKISLSDKSAHGSNSTYTYLDTRYLTIDGIYLAKSCFEKGILEYKNFDYPFEQKSQLLTIELDFLNNFFSTLQHFSNRYLQ